MKKKIEDKETKEFKIVLPFEVKEDADKEDILTIEGYASFQGDMSDEGKGAFVDSVGDVVVVSGIDLKWFKNNPIVLFQHQRDYAIGQAVEIIKKKDGLWVRVEVHKAAMKPEDWYKISAGIIKQFSVGFRCSKIDYKEVGGKEVCFITKSILYEISCVSIACNQMSGYQVMKAYGEEGFYAGELGEELSESTENETKKQTQEKSEEENVMKLKVSDKFSTEEIEKMIKLGIVSSADDEIEIGIKEYIDMAVQEQVKELKDTVKSLEEKLVQAPVEEVKEEKEEVEEKQEGELEEKTEEELSEDELKALEDFLKDESVASFKKLIEE